MTTESPGNSTSDLVHVTNVSTGVLVFLVIIWALVGHHLSSRSKYLSEGGTACLLGLITGCTILTFHSYFMNGVIMDLLQFHSATFFTYLLPPVIFYAGLSVEKQLFFHNLPSILSYGVLGTIFCFMLITGVLYTFTSWHLLRLEDCLALGAIFSATDSVATLQLLDSRQTPLLFSLVFGEGVINDATSVVLLGAVGRLFSSEPVEAATDDTTDDSSTGSNSQLLLGLVGNFFYLLLTSLSLGFATGLGIAYLLRHIASHGAHHEVALIGMLSYMSYLVAEALGLSGILSIFCCGIAVSYYALHNISVQGRHTTINAFQTLSFISEGMIFIYVGMDTLDPIRWKAAYSGKVIWLTTLLIVLLLVTRALTVVPLSLLHNLYARQKLGSKDIIIVWWAGLMRGAVSVALVYYHFDLGPDAAKFGSRHRATLIVSTLVVVLFTVLVVSTFTKPLLHLLLSDVDKPLAQVFREAWSGCGRGSRSKSPAHRLEGADSRDLSVALNEVESGHSGPWRSYNSNDLDDSAHGPAVTGTPRRAESLGQLGPPTVRPQKKRAESAQISNGDVEAHRLLRDADGRNGYKGTHRGGPGGEVEGGSRATSPPVPPAATNGIISRVSPRAGVAESRGSGGGMFGLSWYRGSSSGAGNANDSAPGPSTSGGGSSSSNGALQGRLSDPGVAPDPPAPGSLMSWVTGFENSYMRPIFGGRPASFTEEDGAARQELRRLNRQNVNGAV